jgi:hypothetical protein
LWYRIKDYIEQNNIVIEYYCQPEYHNKVNEFINTNNVILKDINVETDKGIDLWIGSKEFSKNLYEYNVIDEIYLIIFNEFLQKVNIPLTIEKFEYTDPDLLVRRQRIENQFGNKYKDIEILIINSKPLSGQISYNDDEWNHFIKRMNERYKIAITTSISDPRVACTMDDGLSVKDIAAISTNVPIIIAVNSGVITSLFNTYTLENVKTIYFFDNSNNYSNPKFVKKDNINDLLFLISEEKESFVSSIHGTLSFSSVYLLSVIVVLLVWLLYKIGFSKKYLRSIRR